MPPPESVLLSFSLVTNYFLESLFFFPGWKDAQVKWREVQSWSAKRWPWWYLMALGPQCCGGDTFV